METNVTVINGHPKFLYVRVEDPRLAHPIYLTPVYASCDAAIKRDLCSGLHHISLHMDDFWLVRESLMSLHMMVSILVIILVIKALFLSLI